MTSNGNVGPSSHGKHHREAELDELFELARSVVRQPADVDVDRLVTVASARAEGHWSRRLAALRALGLALIFGLLSGWIALFRPYGVDIAYAVGLFAIPAIAVLRWHLQVADGRGIIPWRTPPTVDAWANETIRRVADLDKSIDGLGRLAKGLDVVIARASGERTDSRSDSVLVRARPVRSEVGELEAMLKSCTDGSGEFISACRTVPARANWKLMRDTDPSRAGQMLDRIVAGLAAMARVVPMMSGEATARQGEPLIQAVAVCRREADEMQKTVLHRCGKVLRALDRLHCVAVARSVQRVPGVAAIGSVAVRMSGWLRPPIQKPAIREILVGESPAGVGAWTHAVVYARSSVRASELACSEGGIR